MLHPWEEVSDCFQKCIQEEVHVHAYPQPIPAIPEETVRVAHAVLPEGNVWMQMQYAEGLTDRQAADAVRTRIDWKYALVRRVARDGIPGATRKNEKGGS
jgi:hypothetical protein